MSDRTKDMEEVFERYLVSAPYHCRLGRETKVQDARSATREHTAVFGLNGEVLGVNQRNDVGGFL